VGGSPRAVQHRMAFLLSRPSRRNRSASRAARESGQAALRHARPRVRAIRPHSIEESAMGRRRKLTDERVDAILEWHRNRKTRAQLAQELGIAKDLVGKAIWRRGQYKAPSPEKREANLRERRATIARLNLVSYR
jgi:hypothetical protein